MPIMSSVQSQASNGNVQSQPLVLKEGQMVHGQIKQLFPGQTAEIQIGNQTMVAKLEVPMKAGDSYYFQVNSVKPELQLKIIAGPTSTSEGQPQQLTKLMDAMQLPKSNEMTQLLNFVMKNKIPMTREGLIQAEVLLKGIPQAERAVALEAIQKIVELKLPITETNLRSIMSVQSKEGLHMVLASLRASLLTDSTVPADAKRIITASLDKMVKPFIEATGNALLASSLVNLLEKTSSPESRFATVQLLKGAGFLPERTSLANLQQVITSLLTTESSAIKQAAFPNSQSVATTMTGSPMPINSTQNIQEMGTVLRQIANMPSASITTQLEGVKTLINSESGLSSANKAVLNAIVDQAASARPSPETNARFVQQFSEALLKMTAENVIASPFRQDIKGEMAKEPLLAILNQGNNQDLSPKLAEMIKVAERSQNPEIQKLVQAAEVAVMTAVEGKAVKEAIQTVIRSLGLNYESALLGKNPDIARLAETLKPQLLALMQDPTVSQTIKDGAEAIVTRMNGPLLMSGDTGVQHQLVMQVPLEFFGKRIDAMLEWNGRMKEDGKIDPDFARILFYLDLHSLEKTVIDMQVQNKVVSVTVFNANEGIKDIGAGMIEPLKEGLENAGYKLSGVFFKDFEEDKKDVKVQKDTTTANKQGVDFRI